MNDLAKIENAKAMLMEARNLSDVKKIRNMAEAAEAYAKAASLGKEAENYATEIRLFAGRKAGSMLLQAKETGEIKEGRPKRLQAVTVSSESETEEEEESIIQESVTLEDLGITKHQSASWQEMAKAKDEEFATAVEQAKEKGITSDRSVAKLLKTPHVAKATGHDKWYTPPDYIESVRRVMGDIDLDPASDALANEVVKASTYYDEELNGLEQDWFGRVFLNPPYGRGMVDKFVSKALQEYASGNVTEMILLTNNATDTKWFSTLAAVPHTVCFPTGRISFWNEQAENGGKPLQGQVLVYVGSNNGKFEDEFSSFGVIYKLRKGKKYD